MAPPSIYVVVEITFIRAWDSPRGTLGASADVWDGPNHTDPVGGLFPPWCQTLTLRVLLPPGTRVEDAMLHVRVVRAAVPEDGTRPLVGSATLGLCRALGDNYGYSSGGRAGGWSLPLCRPCGRPQGNVRVKLVVKETRYSEAPPPTPYGVLPPPARGDYTAPPPPPPSYGQVGNSGGMLAVFTAGAAAGFFTGLALAKGFDYLVGKITGVGKKLKGLLASGDDVAEAAVDEGAGDASGDDDAEAAGDEDAGDADDLAFEELLDSDDDAEAAGDGDAGDADDLAFGELLDSDDDAEAAGDGDAGDAYGLAFEELLTSDDDSEAAEDRDAGDAYGLAFEELLTSDDDSEDEDAEDASEDEDDPAPDIIDLTYPDDGGGGGDDDDN